MSDGALPPYLQPDEESPPYSTASYTRKLKRDRVLAGKCVDCNEPAWVKPDGTRARKCFTHIEYDRKRGRGEGGEPRPYVKLEVKPKTRRERRAVHIAAGNCSCGRECAVRDGRKLRHCESCLVRKNSRVHLIMFCTSCGAHGFHRVECETLRSKDGDR